MLLLVFFPDYRCNKQCYSSDGRPRLEMTTSPWPTNQGRHLVQDSKPACGYPGSIIADLSSICLWNNLIARLITGLSLDVFKDRCCCSLEQRNPLHYWKKKTGEWQLFVNYFFFKLEVCYTNKHDQSIMTS